MFIINNKKTNNSTKNGQSICIDICRKNIWKEGISTWKDTQYNSSLIKTQWDTTPHTLGLAMIIFLKRKKNTSVNKNLEKVKCWYTAGRNVK